MFGTNSESVHVNLKNTNVMQNSILFLSAFMLSVFKGHTSNDLKGLRLHTTSVFCFF